MATISCVAAQRLFGVMLAVSFIGCMPRPSFGANSPVALPKITVAPDGRSFVADGKSPFIPFGVNYFRPGTGWAPQVWKKFDADATRRDFARMKSLGVTCVRVFLTYGSFYMEKDRLNEDGLKKFDQFLAIAEESGIYVHPTGPDHWEGLPDWAKVDRIANEEHLQALESFWKLFAKRYAGRNVIFAYDLLNEPAVAWNNQEMRSKWNDWVLRKYGTLAKAATAWNLAADQVQLQVQAQSGPPIPEAKDAEDSQLLLDYQSFRESVADDWTRRQAAAIRAADPRALVTVGFIQWSVPSLLPGVQHYSAFRPDRQAPFLDFLEIHFYPLNRGALEYRNREEEDRNLAYLESVVREVARQGKPVVVAEFGWYGGGKPNFGGGRHPAATEEDQARWNRGVVTTTAGLATGWLNWGLYDHPEARDVTELTGLLTADGKLKAWGREFERLSPALPALRKNAAAAGSSDARPPLDWNKLIRSTPAGNRFREDYYQAFLKSRQ